MGKIVAGFQNRAHHGALPLRLILHLPRLCIREILVRVRNGRHEDRAEILKPEIAPGLVQLSGKRG